MQIFRRLKTALNASSRGAVNEAEPWESELDDAEQEDVLIALGQ